VYNLLYDIIDNSGALKTDYKNRINRVIDFIEAHRDETLTLECLADIACFSRFHFHRIFQSLTGECLAAFIQRIRLEKAATLLNSNPAYSITDIAHICGFASSASFANAFKRHFGNAASYYKKNKSPVLDQRYIHFPDENTAALDIRYTGPYKGDARLFHTLS